VTSLDLAGLVLVASRTLNLDEATVVSLADLEAALAVVASAREAPGGPERQAATLLCGLVRRRVFGPHSGEVGLVAALQLLALHGLEAGDLGPPAVVREWLAAAGGGRIGIDELAAWLEQATSGRRTDMFERFTDRARNAVRFAQEEARLHSHAHVGTEHILLGLIREGQGVGARALETLGVPLDEVRARVLEIVPPGAEEAPSGHIPFTPRSKKVLELSLREALQLGHNYIGTEHLLLGLVRERDGVAAQVLAERGAALDAVRQEVVRQLALVGGDRIAAGPSKEGLMGDIEALYDEIARLSGEVARLTELLRRHGIEPDEGTTRSA
jgi:Clp amino terminal domain, pathogenicity island component